VAAKRLGGILLSGIALWAAIDIVSPSQVRAELPVIDTAAIAQMLQQSTQMAQQLATLVQQVFFLKQQVSAVTGNYGMGNLGGNVNSWGQTSWSDIAGMVAQGINPGDAAQVTAYKQAQAGYATQFPALSPALQTTNPRMAAAYNESYSDAMTGTALGESTFNQVNGYLMDIALLKSEIEQTKNIKSAMDLNTAVNVRVAQMNGELLRTQAAQLRIEAANQTQAANGAAAQAEFFAQ
jgi:hypothetical protein